VLVRLRSARGDGGYEYDQKPGARIAGFEDRRPGFDKLHSQFFLQLAPDRIRIHLAGLALSSREFPEPAVPFVSRALADKEAIPAPDHGCNDAYQRIRRFRQIVRASDAVRSGAVTHGAR